jgi:hypothetical protein
MIFVHLRVEVAIPCTKFSSTPCVIILFGALSLYRHVLVWWDKARQQYSSVYIKKVSRCFQVSAGFALERELHSVCLHYYLADISAL